MYSGASVLWNLNSLEVPGENTEESRERQIPSYGWWEHYHILQIFWRNIFQAVQVGEGSVSRWQLPQIYVLFELSWQIFFFPVGIGCRLLSISIQHPTCAGWVEGFVGLGFFPLLQRITYITSWRNITYSHGSGGGACHSTFIYCSPCENSA